MLPQLIAVSHRLGVTPSARQFHANQPLRSSDRLLCHDRDPIAAARRLFDFVGGDLKMTRKASAVWTGDFSHGSGKIATDIELLTNAQGATAPGFLIGLRPVLKAGYGAVFAGCFCITPAAQFEEVGKTPQRIDAWAVVTLDNIDGLFAITTVHFDLLVAIADTDQARLDQIAHQAKLNWPISRLLHADLSLTARLAA